MKVTPNDIRHKEFAKAMRGFDPVEVRAFLQDVAADLEEALKHNEAASQKLVEMETKIKDYSTMEKALQQTFLQAQETTGKAIENARKEGQLIVQEAEVKASQIIEKSRSDLMSLKEQLTILKAKKDSIVARLKMLLNSELDLVKALEVDEELQGSSTSGSSSQSSKDDQEIEDIIKSLER
jgi:cell division initiation protein